MYVVHGLVVSARIQMFGFVWEQWWQVQNDKETLET